MYYEEIERLNENTAKNMATKTAAVKGHNLYFVTLDNGYGRSCLIYMDGHHIHHADDYELYHPTWREEELSDDEVWEKMKERAENLLFTEEEMSEPLKNYEEYTHKLDFLINYYAMRVDYVSIYGIFKNDAEIAAYRKKVRGMHRDPIGSCYVKDKEFVKHHAKLLNDLIKAKKETVENYDYNKSAFLYEMYNHEYGINYEADWDVLNCFGRVEYEDSFDLQKAFKIVGFTEVQKRAYMDARTQYYEEFNAV